MKSQLSWEEVVNLSPWSACPTLQSATFGDPGLRGWQQQAVRDNHHHMGVPLAAWCPQPFLPELLFPVFLGITTQPDRGWGLDIMI